MQNLTLKQMKINKKALSQIVAGILIMLLAIAAIFVLWHYVSVLIKKPALSPQISCLELQSSKELAIKSACLNETTNELEVDLSRSSLKNNDISSIEFILTNGESSESWVCTNSCGNCLVLEKGQVKTYFLTTEITNIANSKLKISSSNCLLDEKVVLEC